MDRSEGRGVPSHFPSTPTKRTCSHQVPGSFSGKPREGGCEASMGSWRRFYGWFSEIGPNFWPCQPKRTEPKPQTTRRTGRTNKPGGTCKERTKASCPSPPTSSKHRKLPFNPSSPFFFVGVLGKGKAKRTPNKNVRQG